VLTAARPYAPASPVAVADGRPNGELVLATGTVEPGNKADCLTVAVGLVPTDRLRAAKLSILEAVGMADGMEFPITAAAMPLQLLSYLRLARVADPAALASVSFDADTVISPANEYEVLQLLLGECKERLTAYSGSAEDDAKLLQNPALAPRARVAAQLRAGEKAILQVTLDAVRRRLAPIRGVPTKDGGLRDANADLVEIFDAWASVPAAPKKAIDGLLAWARGDNDPEFQKKWGRKKK
jgi:histone-lysine N-methyltransferase SETD3